MEKVFSDKCFLLSIILSLLFLGTGFTLLHFGLAAYGWAIFILLPIVLGISIGALPDIRWAFYGLGTGLIIFLTLLLLGELEGFICVLMALPIVIPCLFIGSIITHLVKKYRSIQSTENLKVLVIPLALFLIASPFEKYFSDNAKSIDVKTAIDLAHKPEVVYDAIKSVDTLDAPKPFLMRLDLPVPQKCVLVKEEVGALRICYFEGGKIVERITELERGKVLKMDVIRYELTGRSWLGFEEATYIFEESGKDGCTLTRITTYTSKLKPRFYWKPLEELGIQQEHQYVLANLVSDLNEN